MKFLKWWIHHTPLLKLDECVDNAMEEYAEQEAIAFRDWCDKSEIIKMSRLQPFQTLIKIPNTEQLYELYKQSNKQ